MTGQQATGNHQARLDGSRTSRAQWEADLARDYRIIVGVTAAILACGLAVFALIMWWVRS
jgi:hypothetical protein